MSNQAAVETKPFSKAETKHLTNLAAAANAAIQAHTEFVQFLGEQHEASAAEGWKLGATGFERKVEAVADKELVSEDSSAVAAD